MSFQLHRCKYCKQPINKHKRCKQCGILLHEKNSNYKCVTCGIQHTLESTHKGYCISCSKQINVFNN